jgi:hypothetical protein
MVSLWPALKLLRKELQDKDIQRDHEGQDMFERDRRNRERKRNADIRS